MIISWLLDYKNRTADLQAEAKERERLEELQFSEPFAVEFLKDEWKWTNLPDGTMRLDAYLGQSEEVFIPPVVGDVPVSCLGSCLFLKGPRSSLHSANDDIKSIVISDGVSF